MEGEVEGGGHFFFQTFCATCTELPLLSYCVSLALLLWLPSLDRGAPLCAWWGCLRLQPHCCSHGPLPATSQSPCGRAH